MFGEGRRDQREGQLRHRTGSLVRDGFALRCPYTAGRACLADAHDCVAGRDDRLHPQDGTWRLAYCYVERRAVVALD